MNSGTIFEPYSRNFDPSGRYQGTANYDAILTNLVSQPTEAFDENLFPYYCYCYNSVNNKLSHVGSLSHDGETFTIHSVPISADGYLKHFVSCVTALGPDMLIGNTDRCTPSDFTNRVQYYNPLNIDFSAYRIGFSFLVKNTDTGEQNWYFSIDELKTLDSRKNIVVQTCGRLFFKIESTGDWGGFVNNDNSSSIIYNCNDRVIFARSSTSYTGNNGIDVVPHWMFGCLKSGQVVAANGDMHDADTGFLIAGVVNTEDGEIRLPISEQYNFTDDGLVIEVVEDWDSRNRITITPRLTIEQTLREVAYLGLIICNYNTAIENVYAGYVDPDGLATGELIPYADWSETDSLNVKNKYMTDFPDLHIKPNPKPDEDKDDIDPVTFGFVPSIGGVGELFQLTPSQWSSFTGWLKGGHEEHDISGSIYFARQVPLNAVSTFDLAVNPNPVEILLNREHTGVNATLITGQVGSYVPYTFTIPRVNNNFLDLSPYSVYELLFPFTSASLVLPDWCLDKTITANLLFDVMTGTCNWLVCADGESVGNVSGKFCIDIALSFENTYSRENAQINSALSLASNAAGIVTSGVLGNVAGVGAGALGALSTAVQASRVDNANYYTCVGSTSDCSDIFTSNSIHLRITHVKSAEGENYAHVHGRPLLKTMPLSELTGYTECVNVDASNINCTLEEQVMIKNLLEGGVYL